MGQLEQRRIQRGELGGLTPLPGKHFAPSKTAFAPSFWPLLMAPPGSATELEHGPFSFEVGRKFEIWTEKKVTWIKLGDYTMSLNGKIISYDRH